MRPLADFQYENMLREAELHMICFFILPLHVLTFHFFFVTDNVHKWQIGDHLFPRDQFFDTVSYELTLSENKEHKH